MNEQGVYKVSFTLINTLIEINIYIEAITLTHAHSRNHAEDQVHSSVQTKRVIPGGR